VDDRRRATALALGAIIALAATLRLTGLAGVNANPFYDAAVRSMGDSLHNLLLGAFDPSGTTSIDKPPVDLWFQVASVRLLGFDGTTLKLPEALASTLAVPLLFDAVRRVFGTGAGLGAALALAVLPASVLTGRSDTMDALMSLLLVAALWSLVRAAQSEHARWVLVAAACVGVAFNVKLFEAFVPVPAFAAGAWLVTRGPRRRRVAIAGAALGLLVAVSLSWLTTTSLVGRTPYAIGSTNGSAWNAAFVFNGVDRLGASPPVHTPARHSRLTITAPGPTRLLARRGLLPVPRLGLELLIALAFGLPALWARRRDSAAARAIGLTLGLWLLTGAVLFSAMSRLHPRYTEAMTPAIAACAGIGVVWLAQTRGRRLAAGSAAALAFAGYGMWAAFGSVGAIIGVGATAAGVLLLAGAALRRHVNASDASASALALVGVVLTLGGLLATPTADAIKVVQLHLSDSNRPGAMPLTRVRHLSAFLRAHRDGARYEFAASAATQAGPLIVHDDQPVLVLTSFDNRPLVGVGTLARDAREGEVRFALLGAAHCDAGTTKLAACSPAARWIRLHGIDVSDAAHVPPGLLWEIDLDQRR
jgi:4-amino-4-deoxy-L-arabinose transferase-like glycosyltransferase